MVKPFALPLAAALLLSACSMAPDHKRPAMPTAPAYPADGAPIADAGPRATDIAWQDFFADPRLDALIGAALQNNRDLRTSVLRIEEARAQYRITRADRLPTIDASGGYTRTRIGASGVTSGGTGPGTGGGTGTGTPIVTTGSTTIERYEANLGVASFEVDFWGRVKSLSDAARYTYLATVEAQRAFRISLIADVADTYLQLREIEERIALAERTVTARERGLEIARLRLDAGVTSALDFRQTETLLTQAQTELAALHLQQAQTRNALDVLVGGPVAAPLPAALPLTEQGIVENIAPGLPSELLTNRPDILAAEDQLRAAGVNIGAARAAFFPRISLTGLLGFASTALSGLFENDSFTWTVGGTASVPLFDFGRNAGNLDLAKVRKDIQVANYERTVQTAFREVADGLAARRYLADQLTAQQRALAAQRDRAELATLRYRNGVAGYIEVLDAERELFAAEQVVVQTRRQQLSNAVDLYVALGGGLGER
ncbi:efflux transporter outer membrane subunit [Sphingoaurantiacus capsulatus]|uniref:Efflux transporter outer membrane subunit n=1 Tax=Sphingoaurantiacus capsulatus TaxID=1771310 RepID=A0ABV7X4P3_9SPHN